MAGTVHRKASEESRSPRALHLSHSRINRYLHCPEQYRLYYIENLRPRVQDANLLFGQILHQALSALFRSGRDPATAFREMWAEFQTVELNYSERDSWDRLNTVGQKLLEKFIQEELPKLSNVRASEKGFRLTVTNIGSFVGVIDLVAEVDRRPTVIDFKTSASTYQPHEVMLSDQLTAYQLAEPELEQTALCVFVKTKEPKIEWHVSARSADQLTEYLDKARYVAGEIAAGHFYKRPGRWCGYCDYLPVCLGDTAAIEETLIQIAAPR